MFDNKAFDEFKKILERNLFLAQALSEKLEIVMEKNINDEILTPEQAYSYLKISKTTILEEERAGRIVPARIGKKGIKRYVKSDLFSYLVAQKSKIEKRKKT